VNLFSFSNWISGNRLATSKVTTVCLLSALLLAVQIGLLANTLLIPHTAYGVTDAGGNPGENSPSIASSSILNQLPVIQLFSSPQAEVSEGDMVILDGSRTYDPDGQVVKFTWTQTDGPSVGALPGVPVASFKAPILTDNSDVRLEFQLTAQDDRGGTSTTPIAIVIKNLNHRPIAYSTTVHVTGDNPQVLNLKGYDPDGDPLAFFPTLLSTNTLHGKIGNVVDYSTSLAETTARVTYIPQPEYRGADSFSYQAVDTSSDVSNVATINLVISN
jgi:hypothetical protein